MPFLEQDFWTKRYCFSDTQRKEKKGCNWLKFIFVSALTFCRASTFLSYLPQFLQIVICYGAIIGSDIFITYLENNLEGTPRGKRLCRDSSRNRSGSRGRRSGTTLGDEMRGDKSPKRRKSRLPSFVEFLNPSAETRRRLSSIGSIWSIPLSRRSRSNPTGSVPALTANKNSLQSSRMSISTRRQSRRPSRRVSLPSFYTPRTSVSRPNSEILL